MYTLVCVSSIGPVETLMCELFFMVRIRLSTYFIVLTYHKHNLPMINQITHLLLGFKSIAHIISTIIEELS